MNNLSGQPSYVEIERSMRVRLLRDWDPEEVLARVLKSQKRRKLINDVSIKSGKYPNWSHLARPEDVRRYVRGSAGTGQGTVTVKGRARFPYVEPTPPTASRQGKK